MAWLGARLRLSLWVTGIFHSATMCQEHCGPWSWEKRLLCPQAPSAVQGVGSCGEVERKVGGLSAAIYKATCCRETASHRSGQHSPFQHSYSHPW